MSPTKRRTPPRVITLRRRKAVSRAYCVREYDRAKAKAAITQDQAVMAAEQKRWDIHFTGVAYDRRYPVIWCGFTSFVGDLLWTFDPETKPFESKGFEPLREPEEVKIHRGLQVGPDGKLYFGTAALVDIPRRHAAPGGRLFAYDPAKDEYEFLGRPVAHDYIQTIDVDHERGIVYGCTYPAGFFFAWDIEKRRLLEEVYAACWPHQVCVDDDGCCWSGYALTPPSGTGGRFRLLKYDPAKRKLTFTDLRLPGNTDDRDAIIDSFINGGDGFLYIGASTGALFRLDPRKERVDLVFQPTLRGGFGALSPPVRGKMYGIAGGGSVTECFGYDLGTGDVALYGPVYDDERATGIHRPHELVLGPKRRLYCPETDNFTRQCYFWETELKG